jgi:hypothetical protein
VVDRADLLDGITQSVKLLEDRDDLRHQVFMHDQLAVVGLAVETDVVHVDPSQPPRLDGTTRPPSRAEFGGGDRLHGPTGRCWRRAGRRRRGRR